MTSIDNRAFEECVSLTAIKVEEGNAVYDSRENCNAIIETESNTLIIGTGGTIIPEGVTRIGNVAFWNRSGLASVMIPKSVTSIAGNAFWGCSGLEAIKVEEGNAVYDSREDCNAVIETESNPLIVGCQNTVIPEGVMIIGQGAFLDCSSLTSITIPKGVTSIEAGAFNGCSNLVSVSMSEGLTSIYESAFINCTSLTSVTIPEGVTFMGSAVFYGCSSLTEVVIPEGVAEIGGVAFYGCSGLTSVTIPGGVRLLNAVFGNCSRLKSVTIKKEMTGEIGGNVFSECNRLETIKVEEGNAKYDSREDCNAIIETESNTVIAGCKNTVIPEGVTGIESWAFTGYSSLTEITIPESVTSIGSYTF